MKNIPFVLLLSLFCLFSCEKQDVDILFAPENNSSECEQCVQFDNLAVGQVSYYQGLKGEAYYQDDTPRLQYLDDTLQLRVVNQEGNVFTLEESIITSETDEVFQYMVQVDEENITFSKMHEGDLSNLVFFDRNKTLVFPLNIRSPQARIVGWFIENDCDLVPCYYSIEEFEAEKGVKVYLDYSPMAYDGNGYFAVYDQRYIHRMMSISAWTGEGLGWELIR